MVHNGIEYGLMQAYAEGFELMYHSEFDLDLSEIAGIWRYGSVVRSWLLELLCAAMEQHGDHLDDIAPYVAGLGRGPLDDQRGDQRKRPGAGDHARRCSPASPRGSEIDFSAKVQAALRNQFGGHAVKAVEAAKDGARPAVSTAENPLLEGLQLRRRPEPCVLIIFGASGDLTQRKLFPALYALAVRRLLPERFGVVGVARTRADDAAVAARDEGRR